MQVQLSIGRSQRCKTPCKEDTSESLQEEVQSVPVNYTGQLNS